MKNIAKFEPQETYPAAFSKDVISVDFHKLEESDIEFLKVKIDGEEFFQCRRAFSYQGTLFGIIVYADFIDKNYYCLLDLVENLESNEKAVVLKDYQFSSIFKPTHFRRNMKVKLGSLEAANEVTLRIGINLNDPAKTLYEARRQGLKEY